jgi:hypothetical protein
VSIFTREDHRCGAAPRRTSRSILGLSDTAGSDQHDHRIGERSAVGHALDCCGMREAHRAAARAHEVHDRDATRDLALERGLGAGSAHEIERRKVLACL